MVRSMPEESPRCRIDAISASAEIHPVKVQLEDLVLGELALQSNGKDRLLQLPGDAAVVGKEGVARKLLSQGRRGPYPVPLDRCGAQRTNKPDNINAEMVAEAPVFD